MKKRRKNNVAKKKLETKIRKIKNKKSKTKLLLDGKKN